MKWPWRTESVDCEFEECSGSVRSPSFYGKTSARELLVLLDNVVVGNEFIDLMYVFLFVKNLVVDKNKISLVLMAWKVFFAHSYW